MAYLSIDNLYKNQTVLMFKEIFSLEKIDGTSAHISWKYESKVIHFFAGGESHSNFVALFDEKFLREKFQEIFPDQDVVIYGEAYGGKQQGMSATYGKELKFIGFDVKVGYVWLNVPNAEDVCSNFGIEFVDHVKIPTDLAAIDAERDRDSVQAIRNGCGPGKAREGIILRPLVELKTNNGERVIAKHKGEAFRETKTQREVTPEKLQVLTEANAIADEYVTPMRLSHILQKMPPETNVEAMKDIILAMIADVYKEAVGEIVESQEVTKAIGRKTAKLFQERIKAKLYSNET